jgi:hypothetical protein
MERIDFFDMGYTSKVWDSIKGERRKQSEKDSRPCRHPNQTGDDHVKPGSAWKVRQRANGLVHIPDIIQIDKALRKEDKTISLGTEIVCRNADRLGNKFTIIFFHKDLLCPLAHLKVEGLALQ